MISRSLQKKERMNDIKISPTYLRLHSFCAGSSKFVNIYDILEIYSKILLTLCRIK